MATRTKLIAANEMLGEVLKECFPSEAYKRVDHRDDRWIEQLEEDLVEGVTNLSSDCDVFDLCMYMCVSIDGEENELQRTCDWMYG